MTKEEWILYFQNADLKVFTQETTDTHTKVKMHLAIKKEMGKSGVNDNTITCFCIDSIGLGANLLEAKNNAISEMASLLSENQTITPQSLFLLQREM